jgi:hypothetical protein
MWRLLPVVMAGFLLGCGDGDDAQRSTASPSAASTQAPVDCSSAGENLTVRDFAGRPKQGYELLEMDPERAELIAGQFRSGLRERFKGYDVRILAREGASAGTAVFVFNTTERAGPDAADNIARGAADSLQGTGRDQAPIDIGGQEGTLVEAADGAFIAISPAGRCSFAVLIADTERMLRDGAALIPSG